jgi:pantoate--beta-alanine ligase
VLPDVAVFGQKDIQQAVTIEKMVLDLNFPVKIIIAPIIREDDGLAMSSRNKHLDATMRKNALVINRSLRKAEEMLTGGARDADMITSMMRKVLAEGNPDSIDYVSVVGYDTLQPVAKIEGRCVIAVAAFFGTTRLIDNMIVDLRGGLRCTS